MLHISLYTYFTNIFVCFSLVSLLAIEEHQELQTKYEMERELKEEVVKEAQKVKINATTQILFMFTATKQFAVSFNICSYETFLTIKTYYEMVKSNIVSCKTSHRSIT